MFTDNEIMEAFRTNDYGLKLKGRSWCNQTTKLNHDDLSPPPIILEIDHDISFDDSQSGLISINDYNKQTAFELAEDQSLSKGVENPSISKGIATVDQEICEFIDLKTNNILPEICELDRTEFKWWQTKC